MLEILEIWESIKIYFFINDSFLIETMMNYCLAGKANLVGGVTGGKAKNGGLWSVKGSSSTLSPSSEDLTTLTFCLLTFVANPV